MASSRRKVALAIVCLLVVLMAISLFANPIIGAQGEDVSRLQPVVAYASWQWLGIVDFELDPHPMNCVTAPSIPQVGRLSGEIETDPNVPQIL